VANANRDQQTNTYAATWEPIGRATTAKEDGEVVIGQWRENSEPPGFNPPPPLDVERLRSRARQIKAQKGMSIQDLVMASGHSRTAVLDMLNGRGRISQGRIDSWWALAWALGIPFGELMGSLDE